MNYRDIAEMIAPFAKLYAGFSGGADSTAMLLAVQEANRTVGAELCAVHFEHGLRGAESLADAEFCRKFCEEHGINFQLIHLDVPSNQRPDESVESAARRCRLEKWKSLAGNQPLTAVVLGHHGDDRQENFFLRLARGSNASGLTGLREKNCIDGVNIIRPLLKMKRKEIEAFLREKNITEWCEDCTNQEEIYQRNFIRRRLLPMWIEKMPFAAKGLDHALNALEQDAIYLEELAEKEFALLRGRRETERIEWLNIPAALRVRVLRSYISEALGMDYIPNQALVKRFEELLTISASSESRTLEVTNECRFVLRGDTLLRTMVSMPKEWHWQKEPETAYGEWIFSAEIVTEMPEERGLERAYFAMSELPETLILDTAKPGERMIPFGKSRAEKLKKLRTDRGFSAGEAPPVLRTPDGSAIWYPMIRQSAFAPVKPGGEFVFLKIATKK